MSLVSILEEFLPVVVFAVGVLAVGRLRDWPAAHLPLLLLGWAYQMTRTLESLEFNYEPYHPEIFLLPFLEGVVALVVVLCLVAVAVAIRSPRSRGRTGRVERYSWISALLAIATVPLDWAYVSTLFLVPSP